MKIKPLFRLVNIRRLTQTAFLALFLYLFSQTDFPPLTGGAGETPGLVTAPVAFFFYLDPLQALLTLLSTRTLAIAFLFSLAVLGLALLFNRAFCGWICPLGTIHQLAASGRAMRRRMIKQKRAPWNSWRNMKYAGLLFVLGAAVFGVNWLGWLDPFSFLTRSLAVAVHPAAGHAAGQLIALLDSLSLMNVSDFLLDVLRGRLIPFEARYFLHALPVAILFITVLVLNRVETRFWCRYLCPLGALLGMLTRRTPLQLIKDDTRCTRCRLCLGSCQGGDQPMAGQPWIFSECHFCANCVDTCPEKALAFRMKLAKAPASESRSLPDLDRRVVLGGLVGGLVVAPVQSIGAERLEKGGRVYKLTNRLIRPPGARPEAEFLNACVKCGACMKVCPANALHPASWEGGLAAIWTPVLVPKIGFCDDRCTLCGQVCPTGAIRPFTMEEKLGMHGGEPIRLGLAHVDRSRCLPWAFSKPCIVCEEVCPTVQKQKAIKLIRETVQDPGGRMVEVQKPVVDPVYCIGCGICENKCPVADSSAIIVTCVGESRSQANRFLLPTN